MDIFTQIRAQLPITDTLTAYGVRIDTHNKALCPFHNEKSPSLVIYPDTNSFYCFGCGTGGDTVSFVGKFFNLDPLQAAQKLNNDFRLGIEAGVPPDGASIRAAQEKREAIKRFEAWIRDAYITLCEYFHLLQDFKEQYRPDKPGMIDIRYVEACHNLDFVEYLIDTLMFADVDTQIQFCKMYRREVERIAVRKRVLGAGRGNRATG